MSHESNNHQTNYSLVHSNNDGILPQSAELCPLCRLICRDLNELNQCTRLLDAKVTRPGIFPEHLQVNNTVLVGNAHNSSNVNSCPSHTRHDAQQISQILCDELRRFCENTTIRGLPRIVRAHNRSLRLLWSTLVCILVLGCFICMFFLARQYLEYNVIHPPRVLRHTSSPFPAVTVCNLRPISPDGMRYMRAKGWKTPRQFAQDFAYYAQHLFFENKRFAEYSAASAAFSLAGFLESLPNDNERRKLGYQNDKLVTKCQMTYLNGSKPVAASCDSRGRWRKFIHPQYLNCATFEPFRELRDTTTSIELYVYLDELNDYAFCPDCFSTEVKSQLSGALIVIHAADCLPNVNDKSINLKPGSLTEIRLSIVENVQKMPPYGRCSPELPESLQLYDTEYAYSEYACRESTIQNDIIQRCGCYSMEYPYNEKAGYEPCGRLPRFVNLSTCTATGLRNNSDPGEIEACIGETETFLRRIMCKRTVTESSFQGVVSGCTMPCAFYSYEAEQSTSSWPTKAWQLTFLNSSYNRRLGVFQGPEFDVYRQAQRLAEEGNETAAIQILERVNLLERNLLAVLINRPNFNVRKVEEKEVLSLTSLLSQTGGLFSIWMGLSMISLGEIFEFFMRCYVKAKNAREARRAYRATMQQKHHEQQAEQDAEMHPLAKTSTIVPAKYDSDLPIKSAKPLQDQIAFPPSLHLSLLPPAQLTSSHLQSTQQQTDLSTAPVIQLHENHLLWINFLAYMKHLRTCPQCVQSGTACFEHPIKTNGPEQRSRSLSFSNTPTLNQRAVSECTQLVDYEQLSIKHEDSSSDWKRHI